MDSLTFQQKNWEMLIGEVCWQQADSSTHDQRRSLDYNLNR
jgi:hypothetical protein